MSAMSAVRCSTSRAWALAAGCGLRDRVRTGQPAARSSATTAGPTAPVAPVTSTSPGPVDTSVPFIRARALEHREVLVHDAADGIAIPHKVPAGCPATLPGGPFGHCRCDRI